jgi:formate hydrogenlyase transcriptional activator
VAERPTTLHDSERLHIQRVLEQAGWRIYGPLGAANRLGLNPSTLRSRMKKLGLSRPTSLVPLDQPTSSYSSVIAEHSELV